MSGAADAAYVLIDNHNGTIYDPTADLTWVQDANLFKAQAAADPNLVANLISTVNAAGGVSDTPNIYDSPVPNSGHYLLSASDFNTGTGAMTWWAAQAWASQLSVTGVGGWRLPTTYPQGPGDEFGNLAYNVFGATGGNPIITGSNIVNLSLFSNIQSNAATFDAYWSVEDTSNPSASYVFETYRSAGSGYGKNAQVFAWAVHSGNVAAVAAVPIPAAVWLFGSALPSLIGFSRRRKAPGA